MLENLEYYHEVFIYLYSLEKNELFTVGKLKKHVSCTDGKLRTIILNLSLAQFVYPVGNKGYKVNEIKATFTNDYFLSYSKDFVKFSSTTFELVFKNTNFYYTLDQNGICVDDLSGNLTYLLAFMLVFLKDYKIRCKADIYKNHFGLVFKRKYYLVYSQVQILACSIKSDNAHLTFGIA